jgi:hypothetical protein
LFVVIATVGIALIKVVTFAILVLSTFASEGLHAARNVDMHKTKATANAAKRFFVIIKISLFCFKKTQHHRVAANSCHIFIFFSAANAGCYYQTI